jgi:endoglucanase
MWKQIATNFRDFDNRLLFAGTNEVKVENEWGPPTEEYSEVQNGFNQTFVTTVRKTGGNNKSRYLIVQGFNTNIDYTVGFTVMPKDTVSDRLMIEVHYYDPYNFTLNTKSLTTQWGSIATDPTKTEPWANEDWVDSQFEKMKSDFIDRGIPVILGEYGVISRLSVADHEIYRVYWNRYVTQSAVNHGMVPIYWDNGYSGNGGLALFDRNSSMQLYPDIINAIVSAVNN